MIWLWGPKPPVGLADDELHISHIEDVCQPAVSIDAVLHLLNGWHTQQRVVHTLDALVGALKPSQSDMDAVNALNGAHLRLCAVAGHNQLTGADVLEFDRFFHFAFLSLLTDYAELLCQ